MMKKWTSSYNSYFNEEIIEEVKNISSTIKIDKSIQYQTILGFGGAFTDSACGIYNDLRIEQKKEVLEALFSDKGLNYNLGRLTIGSCDFSRSSYDYALRRDSSDFSLKHDIENIEPFVKAAMKYNALTLFAAPWTPPLQFKTTNDKAHGGKLRTDCYEDYAQYLCTYLKEQEKRGIHINYISAQNEPEATQPWESCRYTSEEEIRFVEVLNHKIKENNLTCEITLWDHNRDALVRKMEEYEKANPNFSSLVAGFAYHWYDNGDWNNISLVHKKYPKLIKVFTEGCIELLNLNRDDPDAALGTINNAFRYAKNYINDSLNFSNGFIDWNLLLDAHGGPNHVGNFCEALIQYNYETKELIYNPSYYIVKHFAHFIKPNAKRIATSKNNDFLIVSFLNDNQEVVSIILNEREECTEVIELDNKKYIVKLPSHSITTCVFGA